jgi:hypothetical protein
LKPEDSPALKREIETLAAIWPRRISQTTIEAWFQVLSEYSIDVVRWAFDQWPRTHDHFPAPSDIRRLVGDESARRSFMREKRLESVDASQWRRNAAQTAAGVSALDQIKRIKSSPKPPGMAWAHRLREREERGEQLTGTQASLWRQALRVYGPSTAPETEDEREARLEREAIQDEAVMA